MATVKTNWNTMNATALESLEKYAHGYKARCKARDEFEARTKDALKRIADNEHLRKLASGEIKPTENEHMPIKSAEFYAECIAADKAIVEPARAEHAKAKMEAELMEAAAFTLITKTLYGAYVERDNSPKAYRDAWLNWGKALNVEIQPSTLNVLLNTVGDANPSTQKKHRDNFGVHAESSRAFQKKVVAKLCKLMFKVDEKDLIK